MTIEELRRYIEIAGRTDPDCLQGDDLWFFCSFETTEALACFDKLVERSNEWTPTREEALK